MKKYRLLQDYRKPGRTYGKGMVNTAADWYAIFKLHSMVTAKEEELAEKYCKNHSDWFAAEPKFPTKEEIIEEIISAIKEDEFPTRPVIHKCMDAHASSVCEQLIEKINEAVCHYPIGSVPYVERKAIYEIIRNFKSE